MSIAAAVAFVAGTAIQVDANKASQRASKRQRETTAASQKNQDAAALRQKVREQRIKQAQIAQASEGLGVSGSSMQTGATSSLAQQTAGSFANVSAQQMTVAGINRESDKIASAQTRAGYGKIVSDVGSFAFSQMGGFDALFGEAGASTAASSAGSAAQGVNAAPQSPFGPKIHYGA